MNSRNASAPSILECRGVLKRYHYYSHRTTTMREWFIRALKGRPTHVKGPEFVLGKVDLQVKRGEVVALVGPNGSGKSTLLRLIAGIYKPTEGSIEIRGRLAAVMELGVGFHPELTGAENAALSGAIMGLRPKELQSVLPEIFEFADIGGFIDTPVKYYSSGMQARLAFAVSMGVEPDIILLDEVLAVGDESFRHRCYERLESFRASGRTILMVSHDLEGVRRFCERAIWLDGGRIRASGPSGDVVDAYLRAVAGETGPA
ncbi:MAG: ABC transporter ATP-binding protein [Candidatus Eisenbacteria bacterium]